MISTKPRPSRGVTWVNVGLECTAGLSEPLPHYSLLLIVDPILVTFGQICNFCDTNLVTFYLMYLLYQSFKEVIKKLIDPFLLIN